MGRREIPGGWLTLAVVALALTASACASTGDPEVTTDTSQAAGLAESNASSDTSDTTTLAETEADDTQPADPDRPPAPERLVPGAPIEDLVAVVADVHGPTESVATQMSRIGRFPAEFPVPNGGVTITEINVGAQVSYSGNFLVRNQVVFTIDASVDEAWSFYDESLPLAGWSFSSLSDVGEWDTKFFDADDADDATFQTIEMTVSEDVNTADVSVKAAFNATVTTSDELERLSGWMLVPFPAEAEQPSASVFTSRSEQIQLNAAHVTGQGDDLEEMASGFADEFNDNEYESTDKEYRDVNLPPEPLDRRWLDLLVTSNDRLLVNEYALGTFELAADRVESIAQATTEAGDPLVDGASAEELAAVVNEIHGPTSDAAAELTRLGPFPDVPTPPQSELIDLSVTALPADRSGQAAIRTRARLATTSMTVDEAMAYYADEFDRRGWTLKSTNTSTPDDTTTINNSYDIPGVEALLSDPFRLIISDNRATAPNAPQGATIIEWDYNAAHPDDEVRVERWLGWQDDLPLPGSPTMASAGVVTSAAYSTRQHELVPTVLYQYPDGDDDEILDEIMDLVPGSGYEEAEGFLDTHVYLVGDPFDLLDLGVVAMANGDVEVRVQGVMALKPS